MDAHNLYSLELADPRTMQQVIQLCADLQSDIRTLRAQVAELTAMRDTLNAVFTIEAPAADTCEYCKGTGYWTDNLGQNHYCWSCNRSGRKGTGKVQS